MTRHILKVVPPYFDALADGSKTFEVRRNDRAFQRGDTLILWEYAPARTGRPCEKWDCDHIACGPRRAVVATVGFVFSGDPRPGMSDALAPGYVVLSLIDVKPAKEAA